MLEDEADAALADRDRRGVRLVEQDPAAVRVFQPGYHAQQRGLAGTGRPEKGDEFAAADLQ